MLTNFQCCIRAHDARFEQVLRYLPALVVGIALHKWTMILWHEWLPPTVCSNQKVFRRLCAFERGLSPRERRFLILIIRKEDVKFYVYCRFAFVTVAEFAVNFGVVLMRRVFSVVGPSAHARAAADNKFGKTIFCYPIFREEESRVMSEITFKNRRWNQFSVCIKIADARFSVWGQFTNASQLDVYIRIDLTMTCYAAGYRNGESRIENVVLTLSLVLAKQRSQRS